MGRTVRACTSGSCTMRCVCAVRPQWTGGHGGWRSPEVYELVRLVVHLDGCLSAEYGGGPRHPLFALTHDLSRGLRYGEAKRRAHDHDHAHHLPGLLGRLRNDSGIVQRKPCPRAMSPGLAPTVAPPPAPVFFLRYTSERP